MMLNRKLFTPAEAQNSASPGVSTPPNSPAGLLSPAGSSVVSTGAESKNPPEKGFDVETRPAGTPAGSSSETDLSSLLDDDEGELVVDGASDTPVPIPQAATSKPELKEPVAPATPAVEPKAPEVVPTPVQPVAAPVPTPVQQTTKTKEEQDAEWRQMREQAEAQLLKTYELSKDDADALMVDPGKVFPKLAARIHMQAFEAAMDTVARNIPNVIQTVFSQQAQANALKEQFFTKFPALRQHEELAGRFVAAYRGAAGPGVSPDDIANQAGIAAYVHLKLPLDGLPGIVLPQSTPPTAPPVAPFTPAPVATGALPSKSKPANAYTQLAEEFIQDDSI